MKVKLCGKDMNEIYGEGYEDDKEYILEFVDTPESIALRKKIEERKFSSFNFIG